MATARTGALPPAAIPLIVTLTATKLLLHLVLGPRYGFHSDEMYFIECGRNFAFGYVDHPPLVPWIAGLGATLFGESPSAIRFFSALSGSATVALSMLLARRLGGNAWAQGVTGLAVLFAPAYLTMHSMLNIPAIEVLLWTVCAHGLVRIAQDGDSRHWLWIGAVAGIGLLNKHTMVLWGIGVGAGLLLTPLRRELLKPWPWLGAVIALLIFSPNIYWNLVNDWPSIDFVRNLSGSVLDKMPRILFALGQILYMHPVLFPLWLTGLIWLWRGNGGRYRLFFWMYAAIFLLLLYSHGKPYYLAPVYPVLFAGGAVALAQRFDGIPARSMIAATVVLAGVALAPLALPILPLTRVDAAVGIITFGVLPPTDITGDMHRQQDWPLFQDHLEQVWRELPGSMQEETAFLTASYGTASALNIVGPERGMPHAYSGHMNHFLWGPPDDAITTVIATGIPSVVLERHFTDVRPIPNPIADKTSNTMIARVWHVATGLREGWEQVWPQLKRYHHGSSDDLAPEYHRQESRSSLRDTYIRKSIECVIAEEHDRCEQIVAIQTSDMEP